MDKWEYEPSPLGREPIGIWNTGRFTYVTNLEHSVIRALYEERKRALGIPDYGCLTPAQRVAFDLELVERFGLDARTPGAVRYRLREWLYTDPALAAALSGQKERR